MESRQYYPPFKVYSGWFFLLDSIR